MMPTVTPSTTVMNVDDKAISSEMREP